MYFSLFDEISQLFTLSNMIKMKTDIEFKFNNGSY